MPVKTFSIYGTFIAASILFAVLVQHQMWHGSDWWALLGIPGLLCNFLIEGAHGGSHIEVIVGSTLSVIINAIFYFYCLFLLRNLRRQPSANQYRIAPQNREDVE